LKPALVPVIAASLAFLAAPALAQVDASSQSAQQTPAPIVRPRPKPAQPQPAYQDSFLPGSRAASGSTGSTGTYRRSAAAATGNTGTSAVAHRIANGTSGSTGSTAPSHHVASPAASATPAPSLPAAPQQGVVNRTTIVLDPAHGAQDGGSRLADNLLEKDATLALAFKLRSLLQARGFTVVLTRDSDAATLNGQPLTLDDRAGIANHERAAACLLLHATSAGTGVHLYRSELNQAQGEPAMLNWLTAQAPWVNQSAALEDKLAQALSNAGMVTVNAAASVRPVDSLTCPALVLELAPKSAGDASSIMGDSYQNEVAQAIANALVFWKGAVQAPIKIQPPSPPVSTAPVSEPKPHPVMPKTPPMLPPASQENDQ
jgi:N-acetylmuramoyl-L-alanine amidase